MLSGTLPQPAMLTPHQQTVLECLQARRFLEQSGCLSIDNTIALCHESTLYLYARKPWVVDWIFANLEAVKNDAYLICGAKTIGLFCYGESIDEFCTSDILVGNADVTFATSPTMTIATPPQTHVAQESPPDLPTSQTLTSAATELFTIDQLSHFAHQVGFDAGAIADEIRAINPRAFRRNGEDLYELDAAYQAIDRLKDEAKERLKSVAAQNRVVAKAQAPAAKPGTATQKKPATRRSAAKTTAK